jgi:hypothetical protein
VNERLDQANNPDNERLTAKFEQTLLSAHARTAPASENKRSDMPMLSQSRSNILGTSTGPTFCITASGKKVYITTSSGGMQIVARREPQVTGEPPIAARTQPALAAFGSGSFGFSYDALSRRTYFRRATSIALTRMTRPNNVR